MSVQLILNNISRLQRDIQSLHRQLTSESRNGADKVARIAQIKKSITKSTSLSTLQSKQRDIQNLENDHVKIQEKQASINKRIAEKTTELHKYEQQLYSEQEKEQRKLVESIKRKEREDKARQDQMLNEVRAISRGIPMQFGSVTTDTPQPSYDAFISHATEDKDALVRPLAELLQKNGFSIWYDEFQLKVGDSLRRSIDKGLANSRFGIVILSPNFFAKNWTQYELDGLVAKEMTGGKVILPVWHKISKDEVMQYSPSLADKVALNTAMNTIEELAEKLGEILQAT
jgi:hypothetical protein